MTRQIYVRCVTEIGEVLGARSLFSLTDRQMGLNAKFCAAEYFTLGLTSGMCEARAALRFTVYNSEVENSLCPWE